MSESKNSQSFLNQGIAEYLQAVESGESPDRGELLERHPELAEDLRAFRRPSQLRHAQSARSRDTATADQRF